MELRPLGFGEIFDRAVTLYIRNFVPFAAIVMVLIVPLGFFQYVLDRGAQPSFDAILQAFEHPDRGAPPTVPSIFDSPLSIGVFVASLVVAYGLWPFAMNAVAVGVARLYRSRPVEFRACYEAVLHRWAAILGMIGIDFLVVLGWYFAAIVVIVFAAFFIGIFAAAAPAIAFGVGVTVGIVGMIVLLPTLAPLVVALSFSMYSVVIEERPVIASLLLGFARVFNRAEFWRSVLFAIAAGAVMIGGSAVLSIFSVAAAFAHQPALETVIDSVSRAVVTPFGVVLLAVYYFDVRVRREGYDLEASLERLTAAQPA